MLSRELTKGDDRSGQMARDSQGNPCCQHPFSDDDDDDDVLRLKSCAASLLWGRGWVNSYKENILPPSHTICISY